MKKAYGMAAVTVLLWASLPPMTKLLLTDFPSMTLLCYSSIAATLALLGILLVTGKLKRFRDYSGRELLQLLGLGTLGEFLYSALYYQGLTVLPAADACILNYLWPLVAVLFSGLLLKERLTGRKWLALLLSFAGVICVSAKGGTLSLWNPAYFRGTALCLLAALCYGLFNVLNKRFGKDQWVNMSVYFALSALLAGICCHATGQFVMPTPAQWAGILWLGLGIDAVGIVLWALAIQQSPVSSIVNLAYATPVLALLLSALLLREEINLCSILGLALILGGLFLQRERKTAQP